MSTKTQQTQQAQFNPASLSTFHALIPGLQNVFSQYMGSGSPMTSPFFKSMFSTGLGQAAMQTGGGAGALSSWGATPAVNASLLGANSRAGSLMGASSFWNALPMAQQLQLQNLGMASSIRPLQTGQTTTQQQTGLGTWLPSLLSAGVGGLTGYLNNRQPSLSDYQSSLTPTGLAASGGMAAPTLSMPSYNFGPMAGVSGLGTQPDFSTPLLAAGSTPISPFMIPSM